MRKKSKKVIALATLATALSFNTLQVFASPEIEEAETKVQKMDNEIIESMTKLDKLTKDIEKSGKKVEKAQEDIAKTQESFERTKGISKNRLSVIQEKNAPKFSYINALVSSEGITDFISKVSAINTVVEADTDMMGSLKEKEADLKEKKEVLDKETVKLKESKEQVETEKQKLEENKAQVVVEIQKLKAEEEERARQAEIERQKAEEAERNRQAQLEAQKQVESNAQNQSQEQNQFRITVQPPVIAGIQGSRNATAQAPTSNTDGVKAPVSVSVSVPTAPVSTDKAQNVIAEAKKFLGLPYVWGGTTPSGFDCSGYMQYIFKNVAGVKLPRVAREQQNAGVQIPVSEVQPGDLIFWGKPAHHVAMYIGNGQYIHAPQTGDVIKISKMNPSGVTSATRVLN
ncbi:NlpC/P60 family protein [Bacillus cereus]|uniref:Hydrolase n=1 Tax=Bacillus thuringiensis TaxID=1428 RepID=A0A9X6Z5B3_BACTU|nr:MULTISPECIES: C40 family peptidase [Bacillus cereus group]MCU5280742.1 NlpC/P60 family protein [Bacillus cereus]MDF9599312.1 NlpC/P60 family protein [Bacillus cereus]MDG1589643.1 NlpC/P60 family protein [Bacillus cereus]MEC3270743.1 NlpC/P60 family protein [Bacillus thuringiensis]PFB08036.1 hydrolase [Bacillus thuringiensis]